HTAGKIRECPQVFPSGDVPEYDVLPGCSRLSAAGGEQTAVGAESDREGDRAVGPFCLEDATRQRVADKNLSRLFVVGPIARDRGEKAAVGAERRTPDGLGVLSPGRP